MDELWIRTDRAALLLGISENNLRVIGHRRRWPTRPLDGRWVGYHIRDLERERDRRDTLRRLSDELRGLSKG